MTVEASRPLADTAFDLDQTSSHSVARSVAETKMILISSKDDPAYLREVSTDKKEVKGCEEFSAKRYEASPLQRADICRLADESNRVTCPQAHGVLTQSSA